MRWNTGLWFGGHHNSARGSNNAPLLSQLCQRQLNPCFFDLIEPEVFGLNPNKTAGEIIRIGFSRAGGTNPRGQRIELELRRLSGSGHGVLTSQM